MSRRTLSFVISTVVAGALIVVGVYDQLHGGIDTAASQEAAVYHVVAPQQVTLITEPNDGVTPVLSMINQADTSVDLVMYELNDQQVEDALAAAAGRGVAVRVLLNDGQYGAGTNGQPWATNKDAYTYLQAHDVQVQWTPSYFALTHQKTLVVDQNDALIMTFNLTPKYYAADRDFAVDDQDTGDVTAIEQAFNNDWLNTKSTADNGDDLVWSPGSKTTLIAMINSAKKSLYIYNEELADSDVIAALHDAAGRGVKVEIIMTDSSQWHDAFTYITQAGGQVHTFSSSTKAPLYIHAKMIIADDTQAFLGSENFSTASMQNNRELGILISTQGIISQLESTFASDWASSTAYASH